jgi:hypothetical protein
MCAAGDESRGGRIKTLRVAARLALAAAFFALAGCKDSAWTPMGSAEFVLSEIKLRGRSAVSKRLDSDESFGRSVMTGIATGDSVWLDVASRLTPPSASTEASLAIALASALPHSPSRVLALLGRNYPIEEVCGIPFLRVESSFVVSYHDEAAAAIGTVTDTLLTKKRNACRAALDTARSYKLERIDPAYLIKNKPVTAAPRPRRRVAKPPARPKTVTPKDSSSSE